MVKDETNKIYTELMEYMKSIYPNIKGGQKYNENNVKLPYVYFFMLDMPTRLSDLSNNEVGVNQTYQIEVYTTEEMNQAKKMATDIRNYMISLGFRCQNFMPIQTPSNVSRFVGRYERLNV